MSAPLHRRVLRPLAGLAAALSLGAAAIGLASASAAAPAPPLIVKASRIRPDTRPLTTPGTVVQGSAIFTARDFVSGSHGFALAVGAGGQAQYPVITTDGGRIWKVAGGHFHIDAANGPAVVTQIGVTGPGTYFAFGGPDGGSAVDVSTDGGRTWWQTFLPAPTEAVVDGYVGLRRALVAFLQGTPTWVYVSKNGGRTWTYG